MARYADKHMIHTDRYQPGEGKVCEGCVFARGEHAAFCLLYGQPVIKPEISGRRFFRETNERNTAKAEILEQNWNARVKRSQAAQQRAKEAHG